MWSNNGGGFFDFIGGALETVGGFVPVVGGALQSAGGILSGLGGGGGSATPPQQSLPVVNANLIPMMNMPRGGSTPMSGASTEPGETDIKEVSKGVNDYLPLIVLAGTVIAMATFFKK